MAHGTNLTSTYKHVGVQWAGENSAKKIWSIMVSGRGWIQGWTSCSEGCLASSLSYLLPWKQAVTIYLVVSVCAWALPVCMYVCMYVQNERVCHDVSYRFWAKMWHPEDPPPRLLEAQKNTWGGYISGGQVKYFSEISCLPPPKNSRVKGGGSFVFHLFLFLYFINIIYYSYIFIYYILVVFFYSIHLSPFFIFLVSNHPYSIFPYVFLISSNVSLFSAP